MNLCCFEFFKLNYIKNKTVLKLTCIFFLYELGEEVASEKRENKRFSKDSEGLILI